MIDYRGSKDQIVTHVVRFEQFEIDAANGDLPDFSLIELSLVVGDNDYGTHSVGPRARR